MTTNLERGTNGCLDQMPAMSCGIGAADHDVSVNRHTFGAAGNVARQRQHLDLLVELDTPVVALLDVEIPERHALEGPDGRERRCLNRVLRGESAESVENAIAGLEDNGEGALRRAAAQEARIHDRPAVQEGRRR